MARTTLDERRRFTEIVSNTIHAAMALALYDRLTESAMATRAQSLAAAIADHADELLAEAEPCELTYRIEDPTDKYGGIRVTSNAIQAPRVFLFDEAADAFVDGLLAGYELARSQVAALPDPPETGGEGDHD